MRGEFLTAVLGGLAGAGSGITQQRQLRGADELRRKQMATDDLEQQERKFRITQLQQPAKPKWTWDSTRGVFTNEAGEIKELPGVTSRVAKRTQVVDGQLVDLDQATSTPISGFQHPQTRPSNIDPLSQQGIEAAARRAAAVSAATPRPKSAARALPSSAVEKVVGIDNMLTQATDVRDALQRAVTNKVDITGRAGNVLSTPSWVKNLVGKGGKEGTDSRALIGNLYGVVAKERGGSALSAAEIRLLESYIPSENDDETDALIKADRFIKTLQAMRTNKIKAYQQFGFGVDDEAPAQDQLDPGVQAPAYSSRNPFAPRKKP